ncbi:MAG: PAS domain S-box protein, partial [Spirulina sp.]
MMSDTLKDYQRQITALEADKQYWQQRLAELQQHCDRQSRELQTTREELQRLQGGNSESEGFLHEAPPQPDRCVSAEEVLRESEERFRIICEQTGQLIYDYEIPSGQIVWGGAIAAIAGYSPAEFQMDINDWETLIHPDDRALTLDLLAEAMAECSHYHVEYRWRQKDGSYIQVEDNGAFLVNETGKAYRMLGTVKDISERKQAEEKLLLFKRAVESSSDAISMADPQGHLIYQNPAYARLYQCETVEIFNATGGIAACYPDAKICQEVIQAVLEGRSWSGETEQRDRNGRHFPAIICANGIQGESGELLGLIGTISDISDRKAMEERLRQQEAQYRQIFETITDGLGIVDLDTGEFLEVNQAYHQIHGYAYAEFMALPVGDLVHKDFLPRLGSLFADIRNGNPFTCQVRNIHRTGETIDVEIKGIPFPYNGKTHALAIVRDITKRKQLEAERKRQEQVLREKDTLLQMTLKAGKMACWSWHCHQNEILWSDGLEEMLGLESGSFGGTFADYVALIHPDDRDVFLQTMTCALETEGEYTTEHRIVLPDGSREWIRATGGIWYDDAGEAIGLLGSALNDTQRKNAEIATIESAIQIHQQAQREKLLNQIANQIRRSLDLDRILQTTVREIRDFLGVDRCYFAWYIREDEGGDYWHVVAEAQNPQFPSCVGQHCILKVDGLSEHLLRQQIMQLDDLAAVANVPVGETLRILGSKSALLLPVGTQS